MAGARRGRAVRRRGASRAASTDASPGDRRYRRAIGPGAGRRRAARPRLPPPPAPRNPGGGSVRRGLRPADRSSAGVPLASTGAATLWALAGGAHPAYASAVAPEELGPREALRDHLRAGRFLSLLPLLELLRSVTADHAWSFPRPRAAIVIDDPNLRRPSYGHLDYRTLVPHARAHGYHVAVAMVPLDARWTHPAAVRTFRDGRDVLSLLVHGNDHLRGELARSRGEPEAAALVRQALERIMSFERRTHLSVSRVMAPPHEIWGEAFARAMVDSDLEAMCADPGEGWRHELARGDPLADWWPAGVVAGGFRSCRARRLAPRPPTCGFAPTSASRSCSMGTIGTFGTVSTPWPGPPPRSGRSTTSSGHRWSGSHGPASRRGPGTACSRCGCTRAARRSRSRRRRAMCGSRSRSGPLGRRGRP